MLNICRPGHIFFNPAATELDMLNLCIYLCIFFNVNWCLTVFTFLLLLILEILKSLLDFTTRWLHWATLHKTNT